MLHRIKEEGMNMSSLETTVNDIWERRDALSDAEKAEGKKAAEAVRALLNSGKARIAEKQASS
jgi:2,3,4,5-tetrahydropyridine-2-carboxylate N-succinyltransferase